MFHDISSVHLLDWQFAIGCSCAQRLNQIITMRRLCNRPNPDKPTEHTANKNVKANQGSRSKGRNISIDIFVPSRL